MRNLLITGIPRSGTTLMASMVDAQPDTLCLNEPEWQRPNPLLNAEEFAQAVVEDFARVRQMLLREEPVPDRRAADGSALTNYYDYGMKENFVMHPLVRKGLSKDFTLAMKHNGPYLAALPELLATKAFDVVAVVRHPLPVLRSWRRLNLPVSRGQMPNATPYWKEMKALVETSMGLLEKQARMLELMFARLTERRSPVEIIHCEDIIQSSGQQPSDQPTAEDDAIRRALDKFAQTALIHYARLAS